MRRGSRHRTSTVRYEAQRARLPSGVESYADRLRAWRPGIPTLDVDSVANRGFQIAKSIWWVPAGIGFLVLLNAILTG